MNPISTAAGMVIIFYVVYVAIAPTPSDTIDRVCDPVFVWPSNALASGARIFAPSAEKGVLSSFKTGRGRCRAWVWGVGYKEEYERQATYGKSKKP